LMPVLSATGGYVLATDRERLASLAEMMQSKAGENADDRKVPRLEAVSAHRNVALASSAVIRQIGETQKLWIADLEFPIGESNPDNARNEWVELLSNQLGSDLIAREELDARLAILPAGTMRHLCRVATDVRPRIRIDSDGTVADKAYWREEYAPRNCLWFGAWSVQALPKSNLKPTDVADWMRNGTASTCEQLKAIQRPTSFQVGGKASHAKGWMKARFL
jgi:CRISPR/Cas system CMR subunit Cmr4 (Cas7 group RAMP superfamily)